eukprot:2458041-Karenia_brevis.AAC.1
MFFALNASGHATPVHFDADYAAGGVENPPYPPQGVELGHPGPAPKSVGDGISFSAAISDFNSQNLATVPAGGSSP